MTPPPNIPNALTFDGRGVNDGTDPYKPRLLTMSHTCTPELARACAALPQLLQALESVPELPDDYHPHNPDAIEAFVDALRQWQETQRAALTAAGYTFNA